MKLCRFGAAGAEKPGLIDAQGAVRDLSGHVKDITGDVLSPASLDKLRKIDPASLPLAPAGVRMGACVAGVRNFIAVGLNYVDHAKETGSPIPQEPILFNKLPNCIVGPDDDVMVPKASTKLDYEIDSWDLSVALGAGERVVVVDARSLEAFAAEHIPGAINLPHRQMTAESLAELSRDVLYVPYCDGIGCNASTKGALNLTRLGFRVKELVGGLDWWKRDGHPTAGEKAADGATCGVGCGYEGEFFNSGLGCARNVRGITRLLRGDGTEIARDDWNLPSGQMIRVRETVIYQGCCFTPPDVALMGSYRTEISWDEADCP